MEKITYGAPRLVDWVAQIKAGAATVRVHFTGGALTSYGVTPAEYTTDNPFIQKVIEQSGYFKEGRIIILRRTEAAKRGQSKAPKQKPKQQTAPAGDSDTASAESPALSAAPTPEETAKAIPTPEEEAPAPTEEVSEETDGGVVTVEATCLQDAQAYLQENFNISSYKVRTYEAAQRAAAEHGVKFAGAKFDVLNNEEKGDEESESEAVLAEE